MEFAVYTKMFHWLLTHLLSEYEAVNLDSNPSTLPVMFCLLKELVQCDRQMACKLEQRRVTCHVSQMEFWGLTIDFFKC